MTLLSSLLDYKNIYKKNLYFFVKQFDSSHMYSVIDILNNNKNMVKINFDLKFDENNDKYNKACDLLNKHLICKFYICFFNALIKKGKVFKFLNLVMKEISLIIKDENEFIDVANYQLNEINKYNDIIKEKKYTMGTDGEEIKNILGLNILFLLFKKMIEKSFDKTQLIIKDKNEILKTIVHLNRLYLKEFNIISNDEEEKIFLSGGFKIKHDEYISVNNQNKQNKENEYYNMYAKKNYYNIEKYFLQFHNFNEDYFKNLPCDNLVEQFKIFKTLTEKILNNKFIEILFRDKNDLLKQIYEKINFENIAKIIKNEEELNNIKDKLNELKQVKEMNFKNFFDCLAKFYGYLI